MRSEWKTDPIVVRRTSCESSNLPYGAGILCGLFWWFSYCSAKLTMASLGREAHDNFKPLTDHPHYIEYFLWSENPTSFHISRTFPLRSLQIFQHFELVVLKLDRHVVL